MTLLDDLKKLRRTRWSRLDWPADCPSLAARLTDATNTEACRAALAEQLSDVEEQLGSEASLIRYSHCASAVLSALLGLADETADTNADQRYELASRIADVPMATLKTRDGNLLLDALARALLFRWQLPGLGLAPAHTAASTSWSRRRYLESLVRMALMELSPAHGEFAWRQGCQPLLTMDRDPHRLRREISYTAGIEYRKVGPSYCYQVTSSFRSLRTLPTDQIVEVVFCRTTAAMEREYQNPTTISVELCEFDPQTWEQLASRELATDLHIGSDQSVRVETVRNGDTTRLRFELPEVPNDSLHVPVTIRNTYLVPGSNRVYPIRLGNYFTVGPCEMSVTLIDPRAESLDTFVYFGPAATDDTSDQAPEIERFLTPEGARQQTVRVRAPRGSLLWPNSGADFVWRRR